MDANATRFPVKEARRLVTDLFTPRPWIYWVDYLSSAGVGWSAFAVAVVAPAFSLLQLGAILVSAVAVYRAVIFTHELAHLKRGTLDAFRWVWNFTSGFPLMVPSFMYRGVHNDHHKRLVYGTAEDGEYLPFAIENPRHIVLYLLFSVIAPVSLFLRFVFVTPISWVVPPLRNVLWQRASSLQIDMGYVRPPQSSRDEKSWPFQEVFACLYGWVALALVLSGVLPWHVFLIWYVVEVIIFVFNSLRTLVAHRYRNPADRQLDVADQFLDSVNVPTGLLTPLWAPVGLQFHATHHLFPAMPYHALPEAHRRLSTQLSDPSAYAETVEPGMWSALRQLWSDASRQ